MEGLQVESAEVSMDKEGKAAVAVPEGFTPPAAAPAAFTGQPGNLMSDLAALAAEQQPAPVTPPQEPPKEPEQPKTSATAPATPIPAKFQNPDGTVSQEKIEKSTLNAEQAYERYAEIERKLRQKQNEVSALQKGAPIPVAPNPAPVSPAQVNLSPFEIQVAQDLINEAAALGYAMPQAQAIAQARVQVRLLEAKHNAEATRIEQIGHQLEDQERRRELEAIAKHDPWVISDEGFAALSKIRESRPHVNASKTPWLASYREFLADQVMQERLSGQVQTPTPMGKTVKAPPTPVNPAPRVVVQPTAPTLQTKEQVDAHVASLTPEQEKAFWASRGLKF